MEFNACETNRAEMERVKKEEENYLVCKKGEERKMGERRERKENDREKIKDKNSEKKDNCQRD